jgi:PIN domain nuclease of toxin-antitoxin system
MGLVKKEKISLDQPLLQWIDKARSLSSLEILSLDIEIALESCALPGIFHGDTADLMIVTPSHIINISLMTRDKKIIAYAHNPYLKVIEC